MKLNKWIKCIIFIIIHFKTVIADELLDKEYKYIKDTFRLEQTKCGKLTCKSSLTREFYKNNQYKLVWSEDVNLSKKLYPFIDKINKSYEDGLYPFDYNIKQISKILNKLDKFTNKESKASNLVKLDVLLTDAFLTYASDMVFGKVNNKKVYPHWRIKKRSVDILNLFKNGLNSENINSALDEIVPHNVDYTKLKYQLARYRELVINTPKINIPYEQNLKYGMHNKKINLLQKRLLLTGELEHINKEGFFDYDLQQAIIKFQSNNGLISNGIADRATINTLNISFIKRLKQIELNMDRLRWLPETLGDRYVMVNIPDYSLKVVDKDKTILDMPVIVGKNESLQTCVISSKITYLHINPSWNIPNSIAIHDILPKLKEDSHYLSKNNIKIYATYQSDDEIDWSEINNNNFPYKLRQIPGPKNQLGKIKFIFENNCGMYLHDTSSPHLFKNSTRNLSHGCIRIGKPIELATYLLADKPNWNKDEILAAINSKESKAINLTTPINIHIVYKTAWVNDDNVLQFRNDLYKIDEVDFRTYFNK